jgi:hypothetical protein
MYLLTVSSDEMNAAGFFAFCIAAYATAKAGYSRYVVGTKDPTEKVLGRSTLVFPTLLLKPGEKPEDVGPRGYKWGEVMDLANPIFRDSCSGMILPRYLW